MCGDYKTYYTKLTMIKDPWNADTRVDGGGCEILDEELMKNGG
jgi:hypothetical protein